MKKEKEKENRSTYKLEMVLHNRIHDFLVEEQFMHLSQGD